MSDSGDVRRMTGEIEDRYGRVDVLVNDAGSLSNAAPSRR
jgi:NAD(P)-dependent dehydrogenase (short-subunit alcohol dehydrogenase family)